MNKVSTYEQIETKTIKIENKNNTCALSTRRMLAGLQRILASARSHSTPAEKAGSTTLPYCVTAGRGRSFRHTLVTTPRVPVGMCQISTYLKAKLMPMYLPCSFDQFFYVFLKYATI